MIPNKKSRASSLTLGSVKICYSKCLILYNLQDTNFMSIGKQAQKVVFIVGWTCLFYVFQKIFLHLNMKNKEDGERLIAQL